ncbi:tRNA-specific adenosine deaminase [Acidihalobacter prosperus]|uniref:tRNA-specific adenosine deaminase n=1 Tax=Acidihalobacter prosperus TaxID=160660 RepID=A0A1A6C8N4_9GAMM|nr:tRNA adenosine(34) deaminase TadA [Acidihalobacter prosperus]OBS10916.1 tRNA-specific adenosine deaminase [Acidihalobacter prosperus]
MGIAPQGTPPEADREWMRRALSLADRAAADGEVPVGALVVREGGVLGQGWNRPVASNDPTAHAEILALREAAETIGNYRLAGCTLYVTLEPCPMCAGAMLHSRLDRVVFAAYDPRTGAAGSVFDILQSPHNLHRVQVRGGVLGEIAGERLRTFFRARRG